MPTCGEYRRTKAIVFGIRTYVKPFSVFNQRPELAKKFGLALSTLSAPVAKYRGIEGYRPVAVEYLKRCAAGEFVNKQPSIADI